MPLPGTSWSGAAGPAAGGACGAVAAGGVLAGREPAAAVGAASCDKRGYGHAELLGEGCGAACLGAGQPAVPPGVRLGAVWCPVWLPGARWHGSAGCALQPQGTAVLCWAPALAAKPRVQGRASRVSATRVCHGEITGFYSKVIAGRHWD